MPRFLPVAGACAALASCVSAPPPVVEEDANTLTLVAEMARERGDCRAATESYERAVAAAPGEALVRRALEVAVSCQQLGSAARMAAEWRRIAPANTDAMRVAGLIALELGRPAEAREAFETLLQASGRDAERAFTNLVETAADESDTWDAYAALGAFADASWIGAPGLVALGNLAFEAFDFATALRLAQAALARDRGSADAQSLRARVLAAQGEAEAAIAAARAARALDEDEARFTLAEVLVALEQREAAFDELSRLHREDLAADEADRRLALLAFREGDDSEAKVRFESRLSRGEGAGEALFYLGVLAERRGDAGTALRSYQQLAAASASPIAVNRAAALLVKRGERDRAFELLDEHATRNPGEAVDVAAMKARLLTESGDAEAAVLLLDAAIEWYPDHDDLRYQRGIALDRAGRTDEAIAQFEALAKAKPDDPAVLNALGYTLADHDRELGRAERLIERSLEMAPDNPAALDSLGWVRYRRGAAEKALPPLERAYRISRDTEIAAHWGEVLWSLGRESEARAVWARALARDPESELLKRTIARVAPAASPSADPAP
jgi:tetratricopeptide (TPR) repeat protein